MPEKFLKPYNPGQVEADIYKKWEDSGYFNPDKLPSERTEPFTIIMPPPNANGSLHAGHALFVTIQDIMVRYQRMRGKKALWLPGADHAGFETQVVYERQLEKEGRSRFDMQPEDLYKEIMDFTLANKSFMEGQIRQLGASCDWSREMFTLDDRVIKTVYDTFQKLHDDGLLYRGSRIVNWCPKHQTSLSNLETERETRTDNFYYLKYGPFTIATARPETKFGDKYVVMHPDDPRYAQYKAGDTFDLEWINGPITATVVKDDAIDMELGTGVMTITPWHDQADFDIAQRHNLPFDQVIDWRGKLLPVTGEFAGMNIKDARAKIVEKLQTKGLVEKIDEKYTHEVPVCYKCSREIEPQVRPQWFVKMQPLAERAITAIKNGEVKVLTEQHEKILLNWLGNIQDWNISRQIVWGIPIPAWYCAKCPENETLSTVVSNITSMGGVEHQYRDEIQKLEKLIVSTEKPNQCPHCGSNDETAFVRDPDTFDTWFSSGQWPFATLQFPDHPDFKTFYPTTVMETGADILFFWVARMLMLGLYRTDKVPFKYVYLHGMVRDAKGQKMSKSKGNVISPIDVSSQYGTDALRMGLVVGNTPGTDMNLDPKKIEAYKKFANKLWNITRLLLENGAGDTTPTAHGALAEEFDTLAKDVTREMEQFHFHLAAEKLYQYIWGRFASEILEESKALLKGEDSAEKEARKQELNYILCGVLTLLHPFMPFVTEEIWGSLPRNTQTLLMVEPWPVK